MRDPRPSPPPRRPLALSQRGGRRLRRPFREEIRKPGRGCGVAACCSEGDGEVIGAAISARGYGHMTGVAASSRSPAFPGDIIHHETSPVGTLLDKQLQRPTACQANMCQGAGIFMHIIRNDYLIHRA